jgi:hypothetical protein
VKISPHTRQAIVTSKEFSKLFGIPHSKLTKIIDTTIKSKAKRYAEEEELLALDLLLDLNFAFHPRIGTDEWEISFTGFQTLYNGLIKHGFIKHNSIKFYQTLTNFTQSPQDAD